MGGTLYGAAEMDWEMKIAGRTKEDKTDEA
jgi:hypothetical protein